MQDGPDRQQGVKKNATPRTPPSAEPEAVRLRRLTWYLFFRVVTLTVILGTILLTYRTVATGLDPTSKRGTAVFVLIALLYLASVVSGLALRARPSLALGLFYGLVVVDAGATTYAVLMSGGATSGWSALYLVLILAGALVDGRRGASVSMALAAALFLASTTLVQTGVVRTLPLGPAVSKHPLPELIRAWGLTLAALAIVTLLGIHLADQLEEAARRISVQQQALDELSTLHRQILESLDSGVLTTDQEGRITMANPAATRLLSLDAGGGSKRLAEVAPQLDLPPGIHRVAIPDPQRNDNLSLLVAVSELRAPDGSVAGRIHLIQDRTDIDRLEAEIAANERLAMLGRFASAVAHEIRNPLAAISGAIELLSRQADEEADPVVHRLRAIVLREVGRLDELVTKLLEYVKPTDSLPKERIDWAHLLREAVRLAQEDPRARHVDVHADIQGPVFVWAHGHRLGQLHWNLLTNALEASPEGGQVLVRLRANEQEGVLEIRDQGPGIPQDLRAKIFEPFFTTKAQGTGLGLAVVHQVVREHDGRIEIEPAEPTGTVVRVRLPLARRDAATGGGESEPQSPVAEGTSRGGHTAERPSRGEP